MWDSSTASNIYRLLRVFQSQDIYEFVSLADFDVQAMTILCTDESKTTFPTAGDVEEGGGDGVVDLRLGPRPVTRPQRPTVREHRVTTALLSHSSRHVLMQPHCSHH